MAALMKHRAVRFSLVALLFGIMGLPLLGLARAALLTGFVAVLPLHPALRAIAIGLLFAVMRWDTIGPIYATIQAAIVTALLLIAWLANSAPKGRRPADWIEGAQTTVARWRDASPLFRIAIPFAVLALVCLAPLGMNAYTLNVATDAGIYVCLALGLNIVVGMAGLLVLGYAAFYAVGAYTYAILSTQAHVSFCIALPIGGTLAALFGLLLGLPVLRLRGDYLAIVTLGFGEITRITLNNWDSFTHGPNGIMGIAPPSLFGFTFSQPLHYFYLVLAFAALVAFLSYRLERSRIGRAWVAMREDETAAEAMGLPTVRLKLLAFTLAAFWGGLAGVLFASKQLFVSPESFNFLESVMILCMVVLGGMGSVPGVILGAVLLAFLPEVLRDVAEYRLIVFGAAMVALMQYRPQGLWPSARHFMELGEEKEAPP